jgi:hypothetical protein
LDKIKIVLGDMMLKVRWTLPDRDIETETQGAHHSLGGVFYIGIIGIMSLLEVKKEIKI